MKARIPKEYKSSFNKRSHEIVEVNRDMSLAEYNEILDKDTGDGIITHLSETSTSDGIPIAAEFDTETYLKKLENRTAKVSIDINHANMMKLNKRFLSNRLKKNYPFDFLKILPYDDMIINVERYWAEWKHSVTWKSRIIIFKEDIPTPEEVKAKTDNVVGIIMRDLGDDCEGFDGRLVVAATICISYNRQRGFDFEIDSYHGIFRVSDDPLVRKDFRDKAFNDDESFKKQFIAGNDTIWGTMYVILKQWFSICNGIKNPEIREVWETHPIIQNHNAGSKNEYVYNQTPLENVKYIYHCEHQHTGRELTRHTDKWYVREHIAHSKYGKEFIRRGHYKGPKSKDDNVSVEPRKRTVDTWDDSPIDRAEHEKFMALLKSKDKI